MMAKLLPDAPRLRGLFVYDPGTGTLSRRRREETTWQDRRYNKIYAGRDAGWVDAAGYLRVSIDGQAYMASRVIWAMQTGDDPGDEIDHRDRDRANNRWENLRLATREQQMWNTGLLRTNTSGFRGVSFIRAHGRWRAAISVKGRRRHIGYYPTAEDAHKAFAAAAERHRAQS